MVVGTVSLVQKGHPQAANWTYAVKLNQHSKCSHFTLMEVGTVSLVEKGHPCSQLTPLSETEPIQLYGGDGDPCSHLKPPEYILGQGNCFVAILFSGVLSVKFIDFMHDFFLPLFGSAQSNVHYDHIYHPQRSCGKVMFLHLSQTHTPGADTPPQDSHCNGRYAS